MHTEMPIIHTCPICMYILSYLIESSDTVHTMHGSARLRML